MSRKLVSILILAVLLTLSASSVAVAAGSCPFGFTRETAAHHDDHHHQHVGTSADQNGDGYICVKHITPNETIHVHVDNNLP